MDGRQYLRLSYPPLAVVSAFVAAAAVQLSWAWPIWVGTVMFAGAAVSLPQRYLLNRLTLARGLVWLALVVPLLISAVGTEIGLSITSSPAVAARAIIPILGLIIGLLVAPGHPDSLTTVDKAAIAFPAAVLVTTVWSIDPWLSAAKAMVLIAVFCLAVLQVQLYSSDLRLLITRLVYMGQALVIITALQAVAIPHLSFTSSVYFPTLRLTGYIPYIHPNTLGFLAAVSLVFAVYGRRWHQVTRLRSISASAILVALNAAVILLTRTRGAIVIAVLGVVIAGTIVPGRTRRKLATAIVALGGAVLGMVLLANDALQSFLTRGQNSQELVSLTGRVLEWEAALQTVQGSPIAGFGYYVSHRIGIEQNSLLAGNPTLDNLFLDVLYGSGIIGLLGLTIFLLVGVRFVWIRYRSGNPLAGPITVIVSMVLTASLINPTFQLHTFGLVIGLLALLAAGRLGHSIAAAGYMSTNLH